MDPGNLVQLANRIGDFFQAMPDRQEALQGVATHIRRYWDPRMRRELMAHLERQGGAGMTEFVADALKAHGAGLVAPASEPPARTPLR